MSCELLSNLVRQPIIGIDRWVEGIALDSRLVQKDYLFFAVRGDLQNGHDFIKQAIDKGATSIVVEDGRYVENSDDVSYVVMDNLKDEVGFVAARFYHQPTQKMTVIGVTGTNGKTSISHYISQLLALLGVHSGVIGTLGIKFDNQLIATNNTTPDGITLQHYFSLMLEREISHIAMIRNQLHTT